MAQTYDYAGNIQTGFGPSPAVQGQMGMLQDALARQQQQQNWQKMYGIDVGDAAMRGNYVSGALPVESGSDATSGAGTGMPQGFLSGAQIGANGGNGGQPPSAGALAPNAMRAPMSTPPFQTPQIANPVNTTNTGYDPRTFQALAMANTLRAANSRLCRPRAVSPATSTMRPGTSVAIRRRSHSRAKVV